MKGCVSCLAGALLNSRTFQILSVRTGTQVWALLGNTVIVVQGLLTDG